MKNLPVRAFAIELNPTKPGFSDEAYRAPWTAVVRHQASLTEFGPLPFHQLLSTIGLAFPSQVTQAYLDADRDAVASIGYGNFVIATLRTSLKTAIHQLVELERAGSTLTEQIREVRQGLEQACHGCEQSAQHLQDIP